jgi:hypothetical protein
MQVQRLADGTASHHHHIPITFQFYFPQVVGKQIKFPEIRRREIELNENHARAALRQLGKDRHAIYATLTETS